MSYDFAGSPRYQSPMTDLSPERLEKLLERASVGPWDVDGFNEIMAGEPNYGDMIRGGDGESIVAQCVSDRNASLIALAPDLARQRIADAKRIAELEANYNELLYDVSMKHEGESRHETALRYILRAEAKNGDQCANTQEPSQ